MTSSQDDAMQRGRRNYDRWSRRKLIEIGTIIGLLWGGYSAISAYIGARWATHAEVSNAVQPVADTLQAFKRDVMPRLVRVEQRQDAAEANNLMPALARYACLTAERDRSTSMTEAAGLPCNRLLGRIQ
jgi:hypothetical protein